MNNSYQDCDSNDQGNSDDNQSSHLPLEQSIRMCEEILSEVLNTNDIQKALETIEPFVERSIYHSLSKACYLGVISLCTFDEPDIKITAKAVDELNKCCNKYRKTGFVRNLMKMIKTPNYQKYTDLESHAELIHSFSIAMSGGVYALTTYNLYGLIRIIYRMQKFLKHFTACKKLFHTKTEWESEYCRVTYETGIRLSNGVCHLLISMTPPRLLRLVNFLGYGGVESRGWTEINKCAFALPGAFSQIARMLLILYWSYIEPHGFYGANNLDNLSKILDKELEKYPESIFLGGFKAKYEQLCGRIDSAIDSINKLMAKMAVLSNDPFQGELMLCYAIKCQWDECIKYAEILRHNSAHTPALATYVEAMFRYVKSEDESDEEMKESASRLFAIVPTLRIRHFGKTMTPEKIAIVNSEKYFKNNKFLILPEVQLLYQYNHLSFIKGDQILLNRFMDRIDKQINKFKDDIFGSDYLDNYLSALFYKGIIHKLLGQFSEAKECFNRVLEDECRIGIEFSIPPKAVMELGLTELELNNYEVAEKWLNKCINDYSGYLYENYVLLRAYGGLRLMGVSLDKQNEDQNKLQEYRKQWLKEVNIEEVNYQKIVETEESINIQ